MHHMAKDTHIALAIKCTLTKERNKQQSDRKENTKSIHNLQLTMDTA